MTEETANSSERVEPRIRWFNRLGTRLGALFAILLLVVGYATPKVNEGVQALLGWTGPDDILTPGPVGFLPDRSLSRSSVDADGNLVPDEEDVADLNDRIVPFGEAFVMLDRSERVVAHSENLPLQLGAPWHHGTQLYASLELGDGAPVRSVCTELVLREQPCGYLVELVLDEEKHAANYHDDPLSDEPYDPTECYFHPREEDPFVDRERYRVVKARTSLLKRSVYALVIAASLGMVSMITSRLMTRRLRRLSDQATSEPESGSLPGPFTTRGTHDEIFALASSMNTMRDRVGELVDTLETRDRDRREWVAQVSHDLRTPLTALMACLERMRRTDPAVLAPNSELGELLATAELDAQRVMALADDLFQIARMDAGAAVVNEPILPAELVRRTLETLTPLLASRDLDLATDLARGLPTVTGDGRLLVRALENLVVNASHHARERVEVRVRPVGNLVELCVLDDGPGFPGTQAGRPVDLESLDQVRSRADSSGLGLVVARRVAEAHGGELFATNRPEGGASVGLRLPAHEDTEEDSV